MLANGQHLQTLDSDILVHLGIGSSRQMLDKPVLRDEFPPTRIRQQEGGGPFADLKLHPSPRRSCLKVLKAHSGLSEESDA